METLTKKAAVKPSKFRTEEDITKSLGLVKKEKLTPADHKAIAEAAKVASASLRKSNPEAAQRLYYTYYKHSGNAKKAAKSRK